VRILYIERLYYFEMWESPRCLKTVADVTAALKKLKSEASRLAELKEQIRIRVIGLAWSDLHTPWSKGGEAFDSKHLTARLKEIIGEQSKREIPTRAPVPQVKRKELPTLGTETLDKLQLDARAAAKSGAFEEAARAEKARREVEGIGDTRENMQPIDIPTVAIGMRLERLIWYDFTDPAARAEAGADGGFMWCTCTVLAVENVAKGPRSVYKDGEAAWVRWDANDRVTPAEKESEGAFKLLKTRWNKPDGEGAWRLDFDDV